MQWKHQAVAACLALGMLAPALAEPGAVGPPTTVNGVPNVSPPIVKNGVKYYPAVLVGESMNVVFTWDPATHTLYADGVPSPLEPLIVDEQVYLPIEPYSTQLSDAPDPRYRVNPTLPGETAMRARYTRAKQIMPNDREEIARVDDQYKHYDVQVPAHPWLTNRVVPNYPGMSRDDTSESTLPAHLRGGAAPPNPGVDPNQLPNHLPPPGSTPPAEQTLSMQPATSGVQTGVPLRHSTRGGPGSLERGRETPAPTQPVALDPYAAPQTAYAKPAAKARPTFTFHPNSEKNSVFEVAVHDVQLSRNLNGVFPAAEGKQWVAAKVTQKNLSFVLQVEPGIFALRDRDGKRYPAVAQHTQLAEDSLPPGENRQGVVVFELPDTAIPSRLELEGTMPLKVELEQ
ncbi:MAG: DUF4352 domain-containing protein [Candidatus Eremiobacteraeota bacterium]|nr:DUF4352 domain-containing protein [Candidatus Eremiobacteraeota bacterium]